MIVRKSKILLLFCLFIFQLLQASELKLVSGNKSALIDAIDIRGIQFASTKSLARVLQANYFYNQEREKAEIKFSNFNLKFTAGNQFVILTSRKDNQNQVFQIPISARSEKQDVYIPIIYSVDYLSLASGKKFNYDPKLTTIYLTDEIVKTEEVVKWDEKLIDKTNLKFDIYSAKIENKMNGTLVRLGTKNKIRQPASSVKDGVLYIFFNDITIDRNELDKLKPSGLIRKIESKYVKGNPQLEITLSDEYDKHEIFYDEEIGELLISIHNKLLKKTDSNKTSEIEKWKFDVIVLDAGHGGKDPGAIGINGIKEKNINLAIAKKVGNLIKKNIPDVRVEYTREDDTFLELYKRGKIANEKKGNLFISIHCNSLKKKPSDANGFEVYLLRPGRTKEAIEIAEFENSVISLEDDLSRYQKLTDENFILVSMANSSNMRFSESFADMLNNEWIKNVSIPSRGIKQAGFYVLVGAAMPSVLIESGFISNRNDAKFVNSSKGQNEIAQAIYNAILKYKNYYENSLLLENQG